jgi:hypothetical protein
MCAVSCFLQFLDAVISTYVAQVFLNDFEMIPVAPIIICIAFVFRVYMLCTSIKRLLLLVGLV